MNYQIARTSGRPFKRKHMSNDAWLTAMPCGVTGYLSKNASFWLDRKARDRKGRSAWYEPTDADLKADDWEIVS